LKVLKWVKAAILETRIISIFIFKYIISLFSFYQVHTFADCLLITKIQHFKEKKIPIIIIFEKSKGSVGITKAILMFIYYVLTAWGYN